MRVRSALAVFAAVVLTFSLSGCRWFRQPAYYCQPMGQTIAQPATQCAPVVCCPQ